MHVKVMLVSVEWRETSKSRELKKKNKDLYNLGVFGWIDPHEGMILAMRLSNGCNKDLGILVEELSVNMRTVLWASN